MSEGGGASSIHHSVRLSDYSLVGVPNTAVHNQQLVRVRVRACVRACVCACVRVCACVLVVCTKKTLQLHSLFRSLTVGLLCNPETLPGSLGTKHTLEYPATTGNEA